MSSQDKFIEVMGVDAYAGITGLEVVEAEPGRAVVKMPVVDSIRNGHGKVHGGALFTLADYAAAIASNMHGEPTMALDGSVSFLRSVESGYVLAKAETVKTGRRVNFQLVKLYDDRDRLVALFQGGAIKVKRPGA